MTRLSDHRRSAIQRKRQECMNVLTESKKKSGFIEREVFNDMVSQNVMHGYIVEEIGNYNDLSVDEWNQEYDEIINELNAYAAQQLIEMTKFDELYHYEKYEQTNQREADQFAQTYDPTNNSFYICAICKRYVYRCDNFKLEDVMNRIMKYALEHREQCENEQRELCEEELYLKVSIKMMSDVIPMDDQGLDQQMTYEDSQVMLIECQSDKCTYFEFMEIK
ncbi:UNKNOWN [Stylonychia lemnae]|uniref:Uncharacterized protein n=1 Tax=Stylonychia lemnae TaxID=5949 RepID=A0A078A3N4_STYLE|nr:UNKNOWN [Stylonychia lemnae]|eukprot:CDW75359.1 UNKNOWN [Stylonychia lemnae]